MTDPKDVSYSYYGAGVDIEAGSRLVKNITQYATKAGNKLRAVPRELLKVLPNEIFDNKISKTKYDRLAVKGVAIGCLGDPTLVGSKLLTNKDLPKPFLNWIRMSSSMTAIEEYNGWDEAMIKSYGKRKFIEFKFNINDIY